MASAPGVGAIAVIRVSGKLSAEIAEAVGRLPASRLTPRTARLSGVYNAEGEEIDRGLFTFFPHPHSFTGEDCVEISCHGGYAVTQAALKAVLAAGARMARPGEFTQRAFLNGKMDLAQAEAVNQLIRARTQTQRSAAKQTLDGALSRRVHDCSDAITRIAAGLEASIDFPEDVDEPDRDKLARKLDRAVLALGETLEMASRGRMLTTGIRMAIVGRPNVGKSSLLNLLAGRARAIVSDIPGTTRDFLEETVDIGGIPVLAIDTAGLRETPDAVEMEGTRRAVEMLESSDVGLIVLDASEGLTKTDRDVIDKAADRAVAVWNKIDLAPEVVAGFGLPPEIPSVRMCALTGEGLPEMEEAALGRLGYGRGFFEEALAATQRQVTALTEAKEHLLTAAEAVRSPHALDLAAIQIQTARARLGEVTGENALDTLIDTIFSSFCIGK